MTPRKYTSKLLLFGEHIVITGASALALPFNSYYGLWSDELENEPIQNIDVASLNSIKNIYTYIKELDNTKKLASRLDLKRFKEDIDSKVWFDSNIPTGYGLGSSGAVCAAIYDRYGISPEQDLSKLKNILAQLENCFHGQSSGIDPLVCYLNEILLITADKNISLISIPEKKACTDAAIFLIDTGVSRQTTPFVNYFLEQAKETSFQKNCIAPLSSSTESAISAFRESDIDKLVSDVQLISAIQYTYLQKMILPVFQAVWQKGLKTGLYALKLCGAGGGGFILGFTKNWSATKDQLASQKLSLVYQF